MLRQLNKSVLMRFYQKRAKELCHPRTDNLHYMTSYIILRNIIKKRLLSLYLIGTRNNLPIKML